MEITGLTTYAVQGRHWPRFPWVLVEVTTDAEVTGVGEGLPYKSGGLLDALRGLAPALIGNDPFEIEALWERLYRTGVPTPALSAVELALWDIVGKTLGQPVHRLLGGRCHPRLRVYADGFFRGADYVAAEYAAKAVAAVGRGFTALKIDVDDPIPSTRLLHRGISSRDLDLTVAMVQAVRDAVGDHVDLAIDCHGAFDVSTAIRLGRRLEEFGLMWIEDPVPSGNVQAMAKVSQALATPVCTGELLRTRYEYRALLESQAADIVMPDVARTGGILELKKIAAAADTYYVPVAPHNMVGPVATMASLQVCACTPNFLVLEYQLGDVPWRDQIVDPPLPLVDGHLQIPSTPGLGVTLRHDALAGHLVG